MNPLKSAWGTIISGLVIAAAIAYSTDVAGMDSARFVILIHVAVGITWVGLLYYFNFVQVQALAEAAGDEGGPGGAAITKYVAPRALLWFRWAALATWVSGATFLLENLQHSGGRFSIKHEYGDNIWVLPLERQKSISIFS